MNLVFERNFFYLMTLIFLDTMDKFKNSSVIKNATENLFLNKDVKSNKLLFSNTFNFPENVINLHQSINRDNSNFEKMTTSSFANKISETAGTNFRDYNSFPNDLNSNRMYPSLVTPQLKRLTESHFTTYSDKQVINLEEVYLCEEKLWSILEAIRSRGSLNLACEDYFDFLSMNSLQNFENYFFNSETKLLLNCKEILEIVASVCALVGILKNKLDENNLQHLKSLFFIVHQNFLILVDMVLSRLPPEFTTNLWAIKLFSIVKNKQIKTSQTGENIFQLKQNNILILNSLNKYIGRNFKNKIDYHIFQVLDDVLMNIEKYSYSTVKNIILNFVSFILLRKIP